MKPILFNTEMVRAILEGRKKTTRRIVKAKGYHITGIPSWAMFRRNPDDFFFDVCTTGKEHSAKTATTILIEPPARPGDILWVRETWAKDVGRYMYRANYSDTEKFYMNGRESRMTWRPSIHMPKEAARLFLRVTGVRCERLQDMTPEDCSNDGGFEPEAVKVVGIAPLFGTLWDSTIKKDDLNRYGWVANPWVWVIEFERCEKP